MANDTLNGWGRAAWSVGAWSSPAPQIVSVTGVVGETNRKFGWGRGTWAEGGWGQAAGAIPPVNVGVGDIVRPTGVSGTTSVGSVSIFADANVPETGLAATGQVGSVSITADSNLSLGSVQGDTALGTERVITDAFGIVTGVEATAELGVVNAAAQTIVKPTSPAMTGQVGQVKAADLQVTGVEGITALGTVVIDASAEVPTTGLEATASIGTVSVVGTANIIPIGVSARALLPSPITFSGFGDAQISTAQSKFGGASLLLDGSGDYLESQEAYNFSSDPFTVDMWVRPANATQDAVFFDGRDSTSNNAIALRQASDNLLVLRGNGTLFNINGVFSADTWVHIAVTRGDPFGNTFRVFVNGVEEGSSLFGVTASAASIHIGSDFSGSNNWAGYIDELRVSDVDRYGANDFTPPTSAYTADDNTPVLLHFDGANGSTTFANNGLVEAVTVTGTANVPATGLEVTASVGSVIVLANADVDTTGVSATSELGSVSVTGTAVVALTGVSATGRIGKVTVWGKIVPDPGTTWIEIAA